MNKISSKNSKISVIIPVYNVENYIVKCVSSVLEQTYPNLEILLINDCSPDNSITVIEDFLKTKDTKNRVKTIHYNKNKGLSEARNTGLQYSTGDYIYFLDSDDYLPKNAIKLLANSATEHQSDVTIGQTICTYPNSTEEKIVFPISTKEKIIYGNDLVFENFVKRKWPVIACNKLYKSSFLKENKLQFIPNLLSEDELWSFQWTCLAERISFVLKPTYYYLIRENSITSSKKKKNFEDMLLILKHFDKAYKKEKNAYRKILIKKHILSFKEMLLIMQWKALSQDKEFFRKSFHSLKFFAKLSFSDYLQKKFTLKEKKKNFLLHLPTSIGYKFFIWRYGR